MKIRQVGPIVIASAVLALVILCLAVGIVNQQLTSSRLSGQIVQEKAAIAKFSEDSVVNAALVKDYQKLSAKLGGRYRDASWSSHMPFVINQLTGIMQGNKLKIETLKPDPVTLIGGVSRLPLRIGFKAGLGDLAKVVREIEKTTPLLDIESLDIRTTAGSDQLQVDATVACFAVVDKNAPQVTSNAPKSETVMVTVDKSATSGNAKDAAGSSKDKR